MPQVGQHVHAAGLYLSRLRVLVLIDHVLVDRQCHQGQRLGLRPGLAERGQILPGIAIEHQLIGYQLERFARLRLALGEAVFRHRHGQVTPGEHAILYLLADSIALVQWHDQHLLDRELIPMLAGGRLGRHPP
jgi:hypothetical protein